MSQPIIVWFRQDLRLDDNPALEAALETGKPILPLFIDDNDGCRQPGNMSLWWRNRSLATLQDSLAARGSQLIVRHGAAADIIDQLVTDTGAAGVYWNRQYDADGIARDSRMKETLKQRDLDVESFNSHLLFEPWEIVSKSTGGPFRVFTPFWRACRAHGIDSRVWDAPAQIPAPTSWPTGDNLTPVNAPEEADMLQEWHPGEAGARAALSVFLTQNAHGYGERRNLPAEPATSRLSPHLRWGEISPKRIVAETLAADLAKDDSDKFLSEVGWREFAYGLLFQNPTMGTVSLQEKFEAFPWRDAPDDLQAWKRGETGYPIVDAGMRELRRTGYMHNRVRMITASFLVKHLLIDWREGEKWFWECLLDADPANNTASWQWVAGCGADAAPYFRIFNPILQGPKFDKDGVYTKKWCPELSALNGKVLFSPWTAPSDLLSDAPPYPAPIVNHPAARERALASFKSLS